MNLRRKTPPDSLYLLLDTLCNAFGGIILLAVLVVLLTSKEKSQRPPSKDSSEMAARRLTIAEANLRQAAELSATLETKARDPRWQQQMVLLTTRKELQEKIQQLRESVASDSAELDTTNASDPAGRLKYLSAREAAARAAQLEAQNSLAAAQDSLKHLTNRLTDLEKQVSTKLADSERPLRLPKEHDTGKQVVYVLIRYDRFYPCHNPDGSQNNTDLKWVPLFGSETAVPIRDRGQDLNGLAAYLSQLSGDDDYVVFCAFDDSFTTFIAGRQIAADKGIAYGWEPFQSDVGGVTFSSSGYVPKAQ